MEIAKLEAILFVYGEPMPRVKLQKALGISEEEIVDALVKLRETLAHESRGLTLLEHADTVQLVTKPAFTDAISTLVKSEFQDALTPASLETVSVIAYAGPITRAEIDYIRGVNSSFIVRSLLIRGLVERSPHPERANVYRYSVSADFLRHMGIVRKEDLPEYQSFEESIMRLRAAASGASTPA